MALLIPNKINIEVILYEIAEAYPVSVIIIDNITGIEYLIILKLRNLHKLIRSKGITIDHSIKKGNSV
jgi:hypothetical protein